MCSSMGALGLSEPETGLLCGAVLLSPDRAGLADVKAVRAFQDKVLDALRLQVRPRFALVLLSYYSFYDAKSPFRHGEFHVNAILLGQKVMSMLAVGCMSVV